MCIHLYIHTYTHTYAQSELTKLTGSDDTTLAEFLMSLHSSSEVMEFAEEYLVCNFFLSCFMLVTSPKSAGEVLAFLSKLLRKSMLQECAAGVCCSSVLQQCVAPACCRSVLQECVAVVCCLNVLHQCVAGVCCRSMLQ